MPIINAINTPNETITIFLKLNLKNKTQRKIGTIVKRRFNLITSDNPRSNPKKKSDKRLNFLLFSIIDLYKKQNEIINIDIPKFSDDVLLCING